MQCNMQWNVQWNLCTYNQIHRILLTLLTWCVCCSCGSAMVTAQHWELALSAPAGHHMRLCPNLRFEKWPNLCLSDASFRGQYLDPILVELRFGYRWHRTNASGRCSRLEDKRLEFLWKNFLPGKASTWAPLRNSLRTEFHSREWVKFRFRLWFHSGCDHVLWCLEIRGYEIWMRSSLVRDWMRSLHFLAKWRVPGAKVIQFRYVQIHRDVHFRRRDVNSEVLRRHRSTWPKHVTSTTWMPEPLRQTANSKHIQVIYFAYYIRTYIYIYIVHIFCIYTLYKWFKWCKK